MTDKELLGHLKDAVESEVPDMFPNILRRCDRIDREQQNTDTESILITDKYKRNTSGIAAKPKHKMRFVRWVAAVAVMLMFAFGGNFAYHYYSVDSVISLDVNPSIVLHANQKEKVLSAGALNEDAVTVIDGMNLKNVDLDVAVNALIGSMLKHGYVDEINNSILISVKNANAERGSELQKWLSDEVSGLLDSYSIGGAILSQTVSEDERLKALAEEHRISLGKAMLVDLLVSCDERLSFADIAALSINDINLLISNRQGEFEGISSSGQASSGAYIGEDNAKAIALADAEILGSEATFIKVKLDYDDGHMVYEVEFYVAGAEYEYEIDAVTGEVLARDYEVENYIIPNRPQVNGGNMGNTQSSEYIGEASAKSIVLGHADLFESEVTIIQVELEFDDGRAIYDVEFKHGNIEYEYVIDAVSGAIIEFDSDYDD